MFSCIRCKSHAKTENCNIYCIPCIKKILTHVTKGDNKCPNFTSCQFFRLDFKPLHSWLKEGYRNYLVEPNGKVKIFTYCESCWRDNKN